MSSESTICREYTSFRGGYVPITSRHALGLGSRNMSAMGASVGSTMSICHKSD